MLKSPTTPVQPETTTTARTAGFEVRMANMECPHCYAYALKACHVEMDYGWVGGSLVRLICPACYDTVLDIQER